MNAHSIFWGQPWRHCLSCTLARGLHWFPIAQGREGSCGEGHWMERSRWREVTTKLVSHAPQVPLSRHNDGWTMATHSSQMKAPQATLALVSQKVDSFQLAIMATQPSSLVSLLWEATSGFNLIQMMQPSPLSYEACMGVTIRAQPLAFYHKYICHTGDWAELTYFCLFGSG